MHQAKLFGHAAGSRIGDYEYAVLTVELNFALRIS
jgi:hypothetical protein